MSNFPVSGLPLTHRDWAREDRYRRCQEQMETVDPNLALLLAVPTLHVQTVMEEAGDVALAG